MRLPEETRVTILKEVHGNVEDCTLVCHVIETLYQRQHQDRELAYDVQVHRGDGATDQTIVLRLAGIFDVFTSTQARKVFTLSSRIRDVTVAFAKRRVHVTIGSQGNRQVQHAAACKRPRLTAIDYAASQVTDSEDIALMDSIIEAVYTAKDRMPDTLFWFEPIIDGQMAVVQATGAAIPLTQDLAASEESLLSTNDAATSMGADDVSETSAAPEATRVGYALCFSNVPDFSAAFFQHLHDQHGPRIASIYAWLGNDPPLLVVNIRRTTVPTGVTLRTITNYTPRPLPARKRRKRNR